MADACVVDTDVVSFLFRGDSRGEPYRPFLLGTVALVSFMTIAELDRWSLQRTWGRPRQDALARFLEDFTTVFVGRSLCRIWARVTVQARRKGRPIQGGDAWIAASALALGVPLVTHNRRDFSRVDGLMFLPDAAP